MNRICTLALALFAGSFAFGETYTWTGAAGDGQWATPGNWAVGEAAAEAAPGEADTAVFAANTAATVNYGRRLYGDGRRRGDGEDAQPRRGQVNGYRADEDYL